MNIKEITTSYKKINVKKIVCEYCQGSPDYIYFNTEDGQMIDMICKDCHDLCVSASESLAKT